jgi:hypothetical protein
MTTTFTCLETGFPGPALPFTNRIRINTLALGARLPTIHGFREFHSNSPQGDVGAAIFDDAVGCPRIWSLSIKA